MAVTIEELEIIVRAKVEDAIKDLQKVYGEYQKVAEAMVKAKMPEMQKQFSEMQKQMAAMQKPLAEAQQKMQSTVQATASAVQKVSTSGKRSFESLSAELETVNAQMENQRAIYKNLIQESQNASLEFGEDSSKTLTVEKKLLSVEQVMNRLSERASKLQELLNKPAENDNAIEEKLSATMASGLENIGRIVRKQSEWESSINRVSSAIKTVSGELENGAAFSNRISAAMNEIQPKHILQPSLKMEQSDITAGLNRNSRAQWSQFIEDFQSRISDTKNAFAELGRSLSEKFIQGFRQIPEKIHSLMQAVAKRANSAFSSISKGILTAAKQMNVFSRLSASVSDKFKRLGNTIKSALIFSVIYKGLATVREQVGSYLMVNSEFKTALSQLNGVFLTAFQPIYDYVVPALVSLMNVLSNVIAAISQFTAYLFGTTAKKAQSGAQSLYKQSKAISGTGSAAKKTADELEGLTASFDELNIIGKESTGGGGGAAAAVTPDFGFDYEDTAFKTWGEAFDAFLNNILENGIPKLRTGLLNFADWLNSFSAKLYEMFTFPGVKEKVIRLGQDLANAFNDMVNAINWYQLGQALGAGLNLAILLLVNFIYTFDWMNLGEKLAEAFNGIVSEIDWYAFGQLLWAGWKIAFETLAGFLTTVDMEQLAQAVSDTIIGFFDSITETFEKIDWKKIGSQVATFLTNINWSGVAKSVLSAIGEAFEASIDFLWGFINAAWDELISWWHDVAYEDGEFTFEGLLDGILSIVSGIGAWLKEHIFLPFMNGLKDLFGIHSPSTVMKEQGVYLASGLLEGISEKWKDITTFLSDAVDTMKKLFSDAWDSVKSTASEKWSALKTDVIDPIGDRFSTLWDGLSTGAAGAWAGIKNAFNGALSWFENNLINPLKQKFSSAWDKIKQGASGSYSTGSSTTKTTTGRSFDVPQLARGGVLTKPSLVNVAEYVGASSNPEIVSPQSIMYETVVEANAPMVQAMYNIAQMLLQGMENNRSVVKIGDKDIFASAKRGGAQYTKQTGQPAFSY